MKIEFVNMEKYLVIRLQGRIGGEASVRMYRDIKSGVLEEPDKDVVLDFGNVDFIDSSGLGSLVAINSTLLKANRRLILAAVPDNLLQLLKITNLTKILEMAPSVEHATK